MGFVRDWLLRSLVLCGTATALITEILGAFRAIGRVPLAFAWLMAGVAAWYFHSRPPKRSALVFRPLETAIAAAIASIAAGVGITAWLSPPNTFDALAYHLPRVVYWAQARSVAFFPTPYFNQISFPPLAEYLMLHTYVLSGGDRFINLVGAVAWLASIAGVSAIAATLGLGSRAQAFAALCCATLPGAILQASGPKNECLVALWLVCLIYFAVRGDLVFLGLSLGLAVATKGTAYVFAPSLIAGMLWIARLEGRRVRWRALAGWLAAGVLLINAPLYVRNLQLSGSPLGFDSPFGDGRFRWRNGHPGWKSTVSNALRNLSEQLGSEKPAWNKGVYSAVIRVHRVLGLDPQSPDTTTRENGYQPPENTRHESNANNRWQLLLLSVAAAFAGWRAWKRRDPRWLIYAGSLAAAFLLYCWYVRWQQYGARFLLPLFISASPLAAFLLGEIRPQAIAVVICLLLLDKARLPVVQNWTRPLRGPHNLFVTPRDAGYFSDIAYMQNQNSYLRAVDLTARLGCRMVGIDISENQMEYPFQALLRKRDPAIRFVHTGVTNASARYYPAHRETPCAVLCLDCLHTPGKIELYRTLSPPIPIGQFLLFLRVPAGAPLARAVLANADVARDLLPR